MSSQIVDSVPVAAPAPLFAVAKSPSVVQALQEWPPLAAFGSEGQERITVELITVIKAWISHIQRGR